MCFFLFWNPTILQQIFISKYFFFFRYRAIMYPLKRKPTKLISKLVIIMIWICGFLFALPMAYAFTFDNVPESYPIPGMIWLWWVWSTPFGFPFCLPVQFLNSGSSLLNICKWLDQKDFNNISKFVCFGCYMKRNAAFTLISFGLLKWDECLSFQLPFELPFEITFQLLLEWID